MQRSGRQGERPVQEQVDLKLFTVTTVWNCLRCRQTGSFVHSGLKGDYLVEEVRVRHQLTSPGCQFWDTKVRIKTIK